MTDPIAGPPTKDWRRIVRVLLRTIVWAFLLLLTWFVLASVDRRFGTSIPIVLTGWVTFLKRTIPLVGWNWDLIGMAMMCLTFLGFGVHRFFLWVTSGVARPGGPTGAPFRWPLKWTLCGMAMLGLTFLTGMAVTGVVHQTGWLLSTPGEWYEVKNRYEIAEMKQIDAAIEQAMLEAKDDLKLAGQTVWTLTERSSGQNQARDNFQVLIFLDEQGERNGSIIFPRDPAKRARAGALCWEKENDLNDFIPADKIRETIARHGDRVIAW